MPIFTVDTHLFRELGDLLVGRDSTALFELIKNAYDADAASVTVIGTDLSEAEIGKIIVLDNGCGMDAKTFKRGFLRVASRMKDSGERRSVKLHRRFTGAKGIGRLAAHKLAKHLQVNSIHGDAGGKSRKGIVASIDWDAIEKLETLDQIELNKQVVLVPKRYKNELTVGTKITLSRLRRGWTAEEREHFVAECQAFQPPLEITAAQVPKQLPELLLFSQPKVRECHALDNGFTLHLEGDFESGESLWPTIVASSQWVIEIDAREEDKNNEACIDYGISPTSKALAENPTWLRRQFTVAHPRPIEGPFFQARIFVQVDPKAKASERKRIREQSGVRVYVEGFRILPYGEPGNDWLSLDSDYARRSNLDFKDIVDRIYNPEDKDQHWEAMSLPNRSYFGGIFLTQEGAAGLRPLINREGFLPDAAFLVLKNTIRQGIDLCTRVRAASTFREREQARQERLRRRQLAANTESGNQPATQSNYVTPEPLQAAASRATDLLQEIREVFSGSRVEGAEEILARVPDAVEALKDSAERLADEAPMIRVLASVGTQMAAFVHEIRSLLGTAQVVEEALGRVLKVLKLADEVRRQLSGIRTTIAEMRQYLERQAAYLLDIVTPDATRRRSRQKLSECFDSGFRLLRSIAEKRDIEVNNNIPVGLKSPPMYRAELTTVFSNLLSNAIKAVKRHGRIKATAERSDNGVVLRVQNTGDAVDLEDSERWFLPFESSRSDVDSAIGQGFGLGLTITRNMLEPYGAGIRFVEPDDTFATAVEITFPE